MVSAFSPLQWAALAALVFMAGVMDALAGGGGLITLPAYLAVGLPPHLLLGTNKVASSIGTVVSALKLGRGAGLKLGPLVPMLVASLIGSFLGARAALHLDPAWIRPLLLSVLPIVAWLVLTRRGFGEEDTSHRYPPGELTKRGVAVSLPIGAYDGFFGPGTGTFFALAFHRFCGYDLLGATARAKLLNLASNLAAAAAFLAAGQVELLVAVTMGAASIAGHWVGSHLALKRGARAIRPAMALACAALFLKLLLD